MHLAAFGDVWEASEIFGFFVKFLSFWDGFGPVGITLNVLFFSRTGGLYGQNFGPIFGQIFAQIFGQILGQIFGEVFGEVTALQNSAPISVPPWRLGFVSALGGSDGGLQEPPPG